MKSPLIKLSLVATFLVAGNVSTAKASWFSSKKDKEKTAQEDVQKTIEQNFINLSVPAGTEREDLATLRGLQAEMQNTFQSIETKIEAGQTGEALMIAQNILDQVRMNIGVDPKAKLTESFLLNTTFPKEAVGLSNLPESQRILLIKSLRDFKGKLFLDILNLSKRTSFLYAKAFRAELIKRRGALNTEDKQKIIQDLGIAILMPLPIVDRSGNKIVVFGDEVANDNLVYLFNHELKDFLEAHVDLGISSVDFNSYLIKLKNSLLPIRFNPIDQILARSETCFAKAISESPGAGANDICFQRYAVQVQSFDHCMKLALQYPQAAEYAGRQWFRSMKNAYQEYCETKFPLTAKK